MDQKVSIYLLPQSSSALSRADSSPDSLHQRSHIRILQASSSFNCRSSECPEFVLVDLTASTASPRPAPRRRVARHTAPPLHGVLPSPKPVDHLLTHLSLLFRSCTVTKTTMPPTMLLWCVPSSRQPASAGRPTTDLMPFPLSPFSFNKSSRTDTCR